MTTNEEERIKRDAEASHHAFDKHVENRNDSDESFKKLSALHKNPNIHYLSEQMNESSKRTRTALLIYLVTGLLIFVAGYNLRSSWLYTQEFRALHTSRNADLKDPINSFFYPNKEIALIDAINRNSENDKPEFKKHLFHEVYDGIFKIVDVPVLGLEFFVEDMPFIASIGLSIVAFWFLFARRRELGIVKKIYETMKGIVRDNREKPHDTTLIKNLDSELSSNVPNDANTITYSNLSDTMNKGLEENEQVSITPANLKAQKKNNLYNHLPSHEREELEYLYNSVAFSQMLNDVKGIDEKTDDIHQARINVFRRVLKDIRDIITFFGGNVNTRIKAIRSLHLTLGFLMPPLLLAILVGFDIYETYNRPTEALLVPNVNFFKRINNDPTYLKGMSIPYNEKNLDLSLLTYLYTGKNITRANIYAEEWGNQIAEIKKLYYSKADSIILNHKSEKSGDYACLLSLKELKVKLNKAIKDTTEYYNRHATLFEYFCFRSDITHEMQDHFLRFIGDACWDLFILHGLLPALFSTYCFYLVYLILRTGYIREEYSKNIENLYSKSI